jgi:hypothetical protein
VKTLDLYARDITGEVNAKRRGERLRTAIRFSAIGALIAFSLVYFFT